MKDALQILRAENATLRKSLREADHALQQRWNEVEELRAEVAELKKALALWKGE